MKLFKRILVIAAVLAVALFSGCSKESDQTRAEAIKEAKPEQAQIQVVYYALQGCLFCAKIKTVVAAIDEENGAAVEVDVRDMQTEKSQAELADLGFESHGMVFYDADGNIKEKLNGHKLSEEEIRDALKRAM